ncbi:MAG: hypothetical protein A2087_03550 [Spirochaetes bacterium GWD1_61_31]|nr:MAG: hypothetical protein A2Y37_11310 [Spirochaetes bacterium GWB1_60_80]OHD32453.1 MAG: hypothetical protein A2004_09355 [Spirochaetes bacterium GWC1_61_12]OHD36132.1 MAG: hypothetical protein A2087_03550 [Spirochaetes bacterium GWD1_61_31]OHD45018.1 MAG: hypothetical protein A2Y35_13355 [Spirochaetes bacterium GWE1_60_18]OHD60129.1 MAG: hypothetical protein A2Y32_11470 [Spirochaetes bacterium GWF1_60_12]HAP43701.1 hypothetical protein [Spirochaetaceae bacterium]
MDKRHLLISTGSLMVILLTLALAGCVTEPNSLNDSASVAAIPTVAAPTPEELLALNLDAIYDYTSRRDYSAALERLSGVMSDYPERTDFYLVKASLLISLDELIQARTAIDTLLTTEPDNLEALLVKAEIERFSGNRDAQKMVLEKVLQLDADNADARYALGTIHYTQRNYQQAEVNYLQVLRTNPDHVDALVGLARLQYRRRDFPDALASLNRAAELAPADGLVYLDRSRTFYQMGRLAECEADLDRSIELQPSSWAWLERGRLYMDSSRADLALADFSQSIATTPDFFLPYVYRASILERAGQDEAALADYRTITAINTDYWYAWEAIGVLCFRLADWSGAAQAFNQALTFTTNRKEYYIATALAMLMNGQQREARDYASRNLPRIDRSSEPLQWLLLRQVVDQSISSADLEQQIARETDLDDRAAGLFYLGQYWIARGQAQLGLRYVQMALDADRQGTIEWRMAQATVQRMAATE